MDIPVTINPLSNDRILDYCQLTLNFDTPFENVIVCAYMILGIHYVLYGYRFFRPSMFAIGFTFAVGIVYTICISGELLPEYGNKIVSCCAGLLFGLITMLIQFVGLFITGLHSGVLKGATGLALYSNTFITDNPTAHWTTILVCLVCGITSACMNVYWKKGLTIVSTSIYGGALIAISLDYFLEKWAMLKWVYDRVKLEPFVEPPCSFSWIILAVWPMASILGMLVQTCVTGTGIHHDQGLAALKRRSKAVPLTREQKAELRQRKYRYLYQVRTAHGDVISQSYVQALQKNSTGEPWSAHGIGECSTLQSDSTHLTVLATDMPQQESDTEEIQPIRACH